MATASGGFAPVDVLSYASTMEPKVHVIGDSSREHHVQDQPLAITSVRRSPVRELRRRPHIKTRTMSIPLREEYITKPIKRDGQIMLPFQVCGVAVCEGVSDGTALFAPACGLLSPQSAKDAKDVRPAGYQHP